MEMLYLHLGIYIVLLIGISFFMSKKQSQENFLIGGRNRGFIQILLSKFAGSVGVGWFITYTAYSYEFGNGVLFVVAGLIIGYIIFAYWAAPKIYKYSREKKFYTIGDFVYHKTKSSLAKILVNCVSIFSQILWLLVSIIGGAKIMSDFGLFSYEVAVFTTSTIILIYILISGYQAIILTDVLQSLIIIFLLIFISFMIVHSESFKDILKSGSGRVNLSGCIGLFLWGILSVFTQSERYQLCYAAKNEYNLKKGIGLAIFPILVTAILLMVIGLYMYHKNPNIDSALVFTEALKQNIPNNLMPIGLVMFFSGLMSSADTYIYGITSHFIFLRKSKNPIKEIKLATVMLVICTMIFSFLFKDIVDTTILGAAITLTIAVPMIYLFLGFKNTHQFNGAIVGGFIGLTTATITTGISPNIAEFVISGSALGLFYYKG